MKKYNLITASLLALGLTACGAQNTTNESTTAQVTSAPGAPGVEPFLGVCRQNRYWHIV